MNSIVRELCLSVTGDSSKAFIIDTIFSHFLNERVLIIWNAWNQFRQRFQRIQNNNPMTNRIIIEYESCDEKEKRRFIRVIDDKKFYHDKVFVWKDAHQRLMNGTVLNKYRQCIREETVLDRTESTDYITTYYNKKGEIAYILKVTQQYSYVDVACDCTSTMYQYYRRGNVIKTVSYHIPCRFCRYSKS